VLALIAGVAVILPHVAIEVENELLAGAVGLQTFFEPEMNEGHAQGVTLPLPGDGVDALRVAAVAPKNCR